MLLSVMVFSSLFRYSSRSSDENLPLISLLCFANGICNIYQEF